MENIQDIINSLRNVYVSLKSSKSVFNSDLRLSRNTQAVYDKKTNEVNTIQSRLNSKQSSRISDLQSRYNSIKSKDTVINPLNELFMLIDELNGKFTAIREGGYATKTQMAEFDVLYTFCINLKNQLVAGYPEVIEGNAFPTLKSLFRDNESEKANLISKLEDSAEKEIQSCYEYDSVVHENSYLEYSYYLPDSPRSVLESAANESSTQKHFFQLSLEEATIENYTAELQNYQADLNDNTTSLEGVDLVMPEIDLAISQRQSLVSSIDALDQNSETYSSDLESLQNQLSTLDSQVIILPLPAFGFISGSMPVTFSEDPYQYTVTIGNLFESINIQGYGLGADVMIFHEYISNRRNFIANVAIPNQTNKVAQYTEWLADFPGRISYIQSQIAYYEQLLIEQNAEMDAMDLQFNTDLAINSARSQKWVARIGYYGNKCEEITEKLVNEFNYQPSVEKHKDRKQYLTILGNSYGEFYEKIVPINQLFTNKDQVLASLNNYKRDFDAMKNSVIESSAGLIDTIDNYRKEVSSRNFLLNKFYLERIDLVNNLIPGKQAEADSLNLTITSLNESIAAYELELSVLTPGSAEYISKSEQITTASTDLTNANSSLLTVNSKISEYTDRVSYIEGQESEISYYRDSYYNELDRIKNANLSSLIPNIQNGYDFSNYSDAIGSLTAEIDYYNEQISSKMDQLFNDWEIIRTANRSI